MTRKVNRKPKFTDAERARLASITEQLQNPESSLSEQAKALLRRESLEIHKSEETREQLRIEQKVAAKKNRAEAKARAAKQIFDYPAKPTLAECDGDVDVHRKEVEMWQLALDEQKAQKILDSPKYSLVSRDSANRTLRKCAQRRHEIYPKYFAADGARLTPWKDSAVTSANADARSYAEREPFQGYEKRHPKSLEFGAEHRS